MPMMGLNSQPLDYKPSVFLSILQWLSPRPVVSKEETEWGLDDVLLLVSETNHATVFATG